MSNYKQHFLKMLKAAQHQEGRIKLQPLRQRQNRVQRAGRLLRPWECERSAR